jgi:hypothetical protein
MPTYSAKRSWSIILVKLCKSCTSPMQLKNSDIDYSINRY